VGNHDGTQGQTHEKKGNGLEAIEIAQGVPPEPTE
jgi:hypothetical protein